MCLHLLATHYAIMMNRSIVLRPFSQTSLFRTVMVGSLSALGVCSAILSAQVSHAQSPNELAQYTNIARQIERQRLQDYAEVKRIMGGNVPANVCQRGDVPPQVREICGRFESDSRDIITRSGMSVAKFNELTRYCQQSPKPKECPR